MGTYTTNKNMFMPTVGETGWGTLVNGNFETIDTFLKPISLSGNMYTFTGNQTGGSIDATSISNSGTLTQTGTSTFTGKITANGGIAGTIGTFSGAVTGSTINGATITSTKFNGVNLKSSGTITVTPNSTDMGFIPIYKDSSGQNGIGNICLLPVVPNVKYSGSITVHNITDNSQNFYWQNGKDEDYDSKYYIPANSTYTLSFTTIPYLVVTAYNRYAVKYCGFTLS